MSNHDNRTPDTTAPTSDARRPFGFWLRVIDHRLDDAMRDLFAAEGITRRDWRRLNLIAGTVGDAPMSEKLAARPERVEPLVERGWVEGAPGAWRLTGAGESARASLHERVSGLRAKVTGAVSPEDFATTLASLEAIARELGWNEDERMPRRHGRGFGRRHGGEEAGERAHRGPHRGHGRDCGEHGNHGNGGRRSHRERPAANPS